MDSTAIPWNDQSSSRHKVIYILKHPLYTLATQLLKFYENSPCFFYLLTSEFCRQRSLCLINVAKPLTFFS